MYVIAKVRLANNPRSITTKTGTRMESAFGFSDIDSDQGLPVGVVAFGSLADELHKYRKGNSIRVCGTFKANDYVNRDGEQVNGYQITAEGLAGIKSAGGKRQKDKPAQNASSQPEQGFDDDLAF